MLFKSTVNESTFQLLESLQSIEAFTKLRLVGGTALALQIGHRISVDLDLFGEVEFDSQLLMGFEKVQAIKRSESINIFEINNVKVDIVNYPYPWLDNIIYSENIRLASLKDIAAMKIAAITNRGSKKDFTDLYFLLNEFEFDEIITFYAQKYSDASIYLALKSLIYFEDADSEPPLNMLKDASWENIKKKIKEVVTNYSVNRT